MSAVARAGRIDLNADLGEGFGPWSMGDDAAMLEVVSSANVACGGHAGDANTMVATCAGAARRGVVVGAHPSYADLAGFGRRPLAMPPNEIGPMICTQIGALVAAARLAGTEVRYVKLHGALANAAAADDVVAEAVAEALATAFDSLAVLAIAGSRLVEHARAAGLTVYQEVFADRDYGDDGLLVPRSVRGAVLDDVDEIVERLAAFVATGEMATIDGGTVRLDADSVCVHGDTPGAVEIARRVRDRLTAAGLVVAAFAER